MMGWSIHGHQRNYPVSVHCELPSVPSDVTATVSNGATFMPNTFTMQELARMSLDEHLENLEGGGALVEPVIYSVRKGMHNLAWWFAQSFIASRYPYPRRSHATQDGRIALFSSTFTPCVFKRYEGRTTASVLLADKSVVQRWIASWMISIPTTPKLIPLGNGSHLTTLKKLLRIMQKQLGWMFEMARHRLAGKEQGWQRLQKDLP